MSLRDGWSTPKYLADACHDMFGIVDLDPCGSDNTLIKAYKVICPPEDGLSYDWNSILTGWLNPPYSKPCPWLSKLWASTKNGTEWLALVKADFSTKWWNWYVRPSSAKCLVDHRVKFIPPNGVKASTNRDCSVIAYYGSNIDKFSRIYSKFGEIVTNYERQA